MWKLKGKVSIKEVGTNLFIFEFQETLDLEKVQNGRSCSFNRNLLYLTNFDVTLAPNKIKGTHMGIDVQSFLGYDEYLLWRGTREVYKGSY